MSDNAPEACMLESEFKSCCCNCRYHVRDYHHCTTPEGSKLREETGNQCVCSVPRGWICIGMMFEPGERDEGRAHSGWGEHGMLHP